MKHSYKFLLYIFILTVGLNTILPEAYMQVYMLFITHLGLMDSFKRNPGVIKPM